METSDFHKREHITLPTIVRKSLGLRDPVNGRINQQIRVGIDTNGNDRIDETEEYAVYTVVKDYDRTKAAYMGKGGLNRIEASSGMKVILDTRIITSTSCPSIDTTGQYECFFNPNPNQRYLIAIAPHGGSNEIGTTQQVEVMKQHIIVNWFEGSGIQIEQSTYALYIKNTSPSVKSPFRDSIAQAVAEYYRDLHP